MEEEIIHKKKHTDMTFFTNIIDDRECEGCEFLDYLKEKRNRENVICVEMINNNKIYIKFEEDWTIKKLIKNIISHKEFEKIYINYRWKLDSHDLDSLFDLHLNLFRNIKDELETKVDHNLKLYDLKSKMILKSSKYPFFIFRDNCNKGFLSFNLDDYKCMLREYNEEGFINIYKLYRNYLPRTNTINLLRYSPIEDIFEVKQNRVNSLNKLNLDDLISDKGGEDWFTYDDESLNFLMKNENLNYEVDINNNIYIINDDKVYLQDKLPYTVLSSKDYKEILIRIVINDVNSLLTLKTRAIDILIKFNQKLRNMKLLDKIFNPEEKVLKVRSMNDYIIDTYEEIGRFNYITQCIKNCDIPEYVIVDHPNKESVGELNRNQSIRQTITNDNLDISRNKLYTEVNKKGMFNEVSIDITRGSDGPTLIPNRPKNKSNYRKHLMEIKQNINKILHIAKHIPDDNNIKKSQSNIFFHSLKKKKNLFLNTVSFNKGISTFNFPFKQEKKSYFEKISNQIDEILSKELKRQSDIIEEEEEENNRLNQNTAKIRTTLAFNAFDNENILCKNTSSITVSSSKNTVSFKAPDFKKSIIVSPKDNPKLVFSTNNTKSKMDEFLNIINSDIELSSLKRPFSIMFKEIKLKETLNSATETNENLTVINLKCIIMCGKDKFSKKRQIIWRGYGKNLVSAIINKRIYFETKYCNLPM